MPEKAQCGCGKMVTVNKGGGLRSHKCSLPDGPAVETEAPQPAAATAPAPAPVDPFTAPTPQADLEPAPTEDAFTAPTPVADDVRPTDSRPGPWFPARFDSDSLDCGHSVAEGDEIRADGEGGYECRELCEPMEDIDSNHTPAANWNGTGRPRPSAATVAMPSLPTQPSDSARVPLLEQLAQQQAAMRPAVEAAMSGALQMVKGFGSAVNGTGRPDLTLAPAQPVDPFSSPTPQPSPGEAPAELADQDTRAALQHARTGTGTVDPGVLGPDPFTAPTPVEAPPERQETNRYGYLMKDPTTGDFRRWKNGNPKGITRTTTFNKAASDRTALTDWGKRNVVVGASRRPDLVIQAHRKDVQEDKDFLDALVEQLEEAADAKVSASIGTSVHTYTEKVDSGEMTLEEVPTMFRGHVGSYVHELRAAGFRVIPHLMERSVFISEFGGVAGKFDRILHHVPSNTYVMSDLKTGKDMTYGWDEIETQEWIYAHGYNRFGTYHWGATEADDYWEPPQVQVRTDVGLVMWLPVQGPTAGQCKLLMTDLRRGQRHAELCGRVREERALKGKPVEWVAPARDWVYEFERVADQAAAARLWEEARVAGCTPEQLAYLVAIAQEVFRVRGLTT